MKTLLCFKIKGKFAHFRKFYTNSSSLSYIIPPRTAVIGMIASVLKLQRDSYYETFSEQNCNIAVAIGETSHIKRKMQTINNLHSDYYHKFLMKGLNNYRAMHTQCKMELLLSDPDKYIEYVIYFYHKDQNIMNSLKQKLNTSDHGYNIYLGQRQYRAYIDNVKEFPEQEISKIDRSEIIHSAITADNVDAIENNEDVFIVNDQMPLSFKTLDNEKELSREIKTLKRVIVEHSGNPIYGNFKNCYKLKEKVISFLE